ncbi:hypothetical protein HanIR_Chr11g0553191 [Helianthus annuus]|nr:hypothetical protein HanIR_Chr11g0553191 [Helianthus annuus]
MIYCVNCFLNYFVFLPYKRDHVNKLECNTHNYFLTKKTWSFWGERPPEEEKFKFSCEGPGVPTPLSNFTSGSLT